MFILLNIKVIWFYYAYFGCGILFLMHLNYEDSIQNQKMGISW